jgi:valyl-tRNA synthetase
MDTWNTSSLTPYICYGLFNKDAHSVFDRDVTQEFLPMGMRPQAHDIIRTWAFYTIVKTWMHNEVIPWKTMVISGHVLSDSKEKLSKSKENSKTNPDVLLATYPADAIRYWTASGSLGQDIAFSEMQLTQGQRLITKLWNAFRFIHEHTAPDTVHDTPHSLGIINEWILHQATSAFASYKKYLDAHDFNLALDTVESFFWRDMCDNYLELIKDQLFKPEQYAPEQIYATRWTLYQLGLRLAQLYAPYMPHIVETLYQTIYASHSAIKSIHQTRYTAVQTAYNYLHSAQTMTAILTLVSHVRKLKTEHKLSLKTPIHILTIGSQDNALLQSIGQQEQLIKGITHAAYVVYVKNQNADLTSMLKQKSEEYIMVVNL